MNVNNFTPSNGRFVKENGETVNIADLIGGKSTGRRADIGKYTPHTGRMIKENGEVINIADGLEEFVNSGGSGSGGPAEIKKIEMTETTAELQPNTQYTWQEVTELNLTFANEKEGILNIFAFSFVSGDTATKVTLPEEINIGDFVVEPKQKYEITIENNNLLYSSWEV